MDHSGWLAEASLQLPHTALLATVLIILLIPTIRKLVWDVMETILASALLLVLVLVVLGLPFGAAYILFKGALFILHSLTATFPQIAEVSNSVLHQFKLLLARQ